MQRSAGRVRGSHTLGFYVPHRPSTTGVSLRITPDRSFSSFPTSPISAPLLSSTSISSKSSSSSSPRLFNFAPSNRTNFALLEVKPNNLAGKRFYAILPNPLAFSNNPASRACPSSRQISSIRRYSTEPPVPTTTNPATTTAVADHSDLPPNGDVVSPTMTENLILDPVNPDVIATTAAAATDHYLPTVNWLIQAMEYVHHTVPLPWWATIIAFTVGFRTLLLPVIVSTKKNSMKMMALQPELQKVREKFQAERFTNPNANQEYITHTRDVMKKHDVKLTRSLRPMLIQLPVFVSMFLAFRHLSETAPQALQDGGMLWFTNLAVPDPFWGLPLCTAATFLATIELNSDGLATTQQTVVMRYVLRGLAVAMVPMTYNFPASVHLYWTVSNIYSLGQVLLFKIPFVKRICNLPDDPSKPVPVEQLRPKVVYANRPPKGAAAEAKPANPARVKP